MAQLYGTSTTSRTRIPSSEYNTALLDSYQENIYHQGPRLHHNQLHDLELPPLQVRRRNIRLAYYYRVVEGLMPAILPQEYLALRKLGRTICAKSYSDSLCHKHWYIERSVCNSRGFSVRLSRTYQYKNPFFIRTTVGWNNLRDSTVSCDSIEGFKSPLESRD